MKLKVKKGDSVIVISGKHRGIKGKVLKVFVSDQKLIVSGVNVVKKHVKPSRDNAGGIITKELPIHVSNVSHIDPLSGQASKIGYRTLDDGTKLRFAKKSGEIIGGV